MNELDPSVYRGFLRRLKAHGQYRKASQEIGHHWIVIRAHERRNAEFKAEIAAIQLAWARKLGVQPGVNFRHRLAWAFRKQPKLKATASSESRADTNPPAAAEPIHEAATADAIDQNTDQDAEDLARPMWTPLPGPQRQAYDSPADILLYGGAAGGGKSELLLGLALTQHRRAIVFRREYPQLKALEDRAQVMTLLNGRLSNSRHLLRFRLDRSQRQLDRQLEFGAVYLPQDMQRYQGRAHDLKAFDEITHFTEAQFKFLIAWNRSADPAQRVRVVAAGNPPATPEGGWVVKYWAAWLDPAHPRPAKPGELRWYATIDGEERELPSGAAFVHDGETVQPVSRSFIPARVEDNPYLMANGYKARLQSLPEPLRSQMLRGDFGLAMTDEPNQLIPTAWVKRAMDRWTHIPPEQFRQMTHIGVDVARGGRDRSVITTRHGLWFNWQRSIPGRDTPSGKELATTIIQIMSLGLGGPNDGKSRQMHPMVQVDVIGVGGAVHDMLQLQGVVSVPLSSAAISPARDRTGQLSFLNKRAEWWWRLREALDPDIGLGLMLPPDPELLGDLTSPRWELSAHGIKIEAKDRIRERLGRSPDKGDSLIYAWAEAQDENWAYIRRELDKRRAAEAAKAPPPQLQMVARTTFGQPPFAFNPDRTRRPDMEPLDPATVKPGPWWKWDKQNRFRQVDPWAKYK